jgi:hypothetical protein
LALAEQFTYQDAASKCDHEIQVSLAKVSDNYAHELNALMDTFRLRGDLEKTLAVKKEIARFESDKTLEGKNLVEVPVQLRELQQKFLAAPGKAIEEIAKSYVVKLEDAKRKLTIDDKLDEAISAQQEIDKILKKYAIVNPTKGSEIQTQDLPKYIRMSRDVKIPTIVDGQQVGYTGLSTGDAYNLVKVDGAQVTIRLDKSDVVIPVDTTDLLKRIERRQKGLSEEDAQEVEAQAAAPRDRLGRTWHIYEAFGHDWQGEWKRRGNSNTFNGNYWKIGAQDTHVCVVTVTIRGQDILAQRKCTDGSDTTYTGTLSSNGRSASGTDSVGAPWTATISSW